MVDTTINNLIPSVWVENLLKFERNLQEMWFFRVN